MRKKKTEDEAINEALTEAKRQAIQREWEGASSMKTSGNTTASGDINGTYGTTSVAGYSTISSPTISTSPSYPQEWKEPKWVAKLTEVIDRLADRVEDLTLLLTEDPAD